MSYYVKRTRIPMDACWATKLGQREEHDLRTCSHYVNQVGWVGPIRSARQADREVQAWQDTGQWDALRFDADPIIRKAVREWQRDANERHGRTS